VKSFPFNFGDLQVVQMINGQIQENAYLVRHTGGDAVLIDPGDEAEAILETVRNSNANVLAILLTHAHFDHIGAVQALREALKIKVYLHQDAWGPYSRAHMTPARYAMPFQQPEAPDEALEAGPLKFGSLEFTALDTPGHAPGHLSFYSNAGFVLSGDALFNHSIGRTDIPGADQDLLIERIKTQLYTLPDETVVLSGHGRDTTIGREKAGNPFTKSLT
jgi:hydroxyacylglutathione hydrolase